MNEQEAETETTETDEVDRKMVEETEPREVEQPVDNDDAAE